MADPHQPQQEPKREEGFSLFRPKEWPLFIWNKFSRAPLIRRLRLGRVKIGGRPHPIEEDIRDVWLTKNGLLFNGPLETIEKSCDSQSSLIGFSDSNKDALILGNPQGVVPLYKSLGPYADIDRIESEKHWFQFGTGVEEEDVSFELPDEREWKKYKWVPEEVRKLRSNPSEPWKKYRVKKYKINPGIVFHEGKQGLREELYGFGFHKIRKLAPTVKKFVNSVVLEDLRRARLPVEIRTKMTHVVGAFEELFEEVGRIEEGTYKKLADLKFQVETYDQLWDKMVKDHTPERKDIIMRFPHSYIIIKTYLNEQLKNVPTKRVDDNGEVVEEATEEIKVVYFDRSKNPFETELREVEAVISNLGGDARIRREAENKLIRIRLIPGEIIEKNNEIKPLMLGELRGQFKNSVVEHLYYR